MLRHKAVFGEMPCVDRTKEELTVLRRYPDAVPVEFRRGGDMLGVLNAIRKNRLVEVRAAVGAGKSTRLPMMIAKSLGCVVLHVIPFHIAAKSLVRYLATCDDGDKVVYMDDLESDMPKHGVVVVDGPFFFARLLRDKFAGVENMVLFLDESHESDAWTSTLRDLAPAITSLRSVVKSSATASPGVSMNADLPAARVSKVYRTVNVDTWSANDRDKPWSAVTIDKSVVMMIDRENTRAVLRDQYLQYGFEVRDCCNQDDNYYAESLRMAKDPKAGIVIMMVDYKFRSSLSIPGFSRFVDSCEVAVPQVRDGLPLVTYRAAYDFEIQQFAGRAGRIEGCPTEVYRNDMPPIKRMCDREALECDAANLLYRLVGYRPPVELAEYDYFSGSVPADIALAMASDQPLTLYPHDARVPWVNGHKAAEEEKKKAAFEYALQNRKAKPVSCHTVVDVRRSVSPPPDVPMRYAIEQVDIDGLSVYSGSRSSSPVAQLELDRGCYDNLSVTQEYAMRRPKRNAKLLEEERERKSRELEHARAEARLSGLPSPVEGQAVVVAEQELGQLKSERVLKRQDTTVARVGETVSRAEFLSHGTERVNSIQPVYEALKRREHEGQELDPGTYYHYHGMDTAPEKTITFLRGLESVVSFAETRGSRQYVGGLSDSDRMYAMRELVEACNLSTSIVVGVQRLFAEVGRRDESSWKDIVDHAAMVSEVESLTTLCAAEQAKVHVYLALMPLFAKYSLDKMPPPVDLENRVMIDVMKQFERAAVKKDPDKLAEYWDKLNTHNTITRGRIRGRREATMILRGR